MIRPVAALVAGLTLLGTAATTRAELRADELLLVTNRNEPASGTLAAQYAAARHVPAGHVLELDTPKTEEIAPDVYEQAIAAPVRAYLASPAGKGVRCIVLFYGLPLRVAARTMSPETTAELSALRALAVQLDGLADAATKELDAVARDAGVDPQGGTTGGAEADLAHVKAIEAALNPALGKLDAAHRDAIVRRLQAAHQAAAAQTAAAFHAAFPQAAAQPLATSDAVQAAFQHPRDPVGRAQVRQAVAATDGIFALFDIVVFQSTWIDETESNASVDSELALVQQGDYPHFRWQGNHLNYRATSQTSQLMTARIDAPTPQIAARMIDDSIAVEAMGLDGRVVFDSRGLPAVTNGKPDPYGWYDQTLRDTAAYLKSKTKLDVVTDDREAVLPPHSVTGVALYCGWYSLRQYVPACGFVRGAMGYHVASFELVSLHDRFEKGWVANLLRDGMCATSGPVAEPYLGSFPKPNEFFPLLLTGKLTLAEVYWKTCPMVSWMQTLIGDPLYRPYAKHPALAVDDLPAELQAAIPKN